MPAAGAGGGDALVDVGRPRRTPPNLASEIGAPVDALPRQVGIELEGMPANRPGARAEVDSSRDPRERSFEPPLADVAPGAYDVGNDVDRRGAVGGLGSGMSGVPWEGCGGGDYRRMSRRGARDNVSPADLALSPRAGARGPSALHSSCRHDRPRPHRHLLPRSSTILAMPACRGGSRAPLRRTRARRDALAGPAGAARAHGPRRRSGRATRQPCEGRGPAPGRPFPDAAPADVVVEAFGCALPENVSPPWRARAPRRPGSSSNT